MIFFRAPAGKYGLDLKGALFLGGAPHFPNWLPYKAGFKGEVQHDFLQGLQSVQAVWDLGLLKIMIINQFKTNCRVPGSSEGWGARDFCSLP